MKETEEFPTAAAVRAELDSLEQIKNRALFESAKSAVRRAIAQKASSVQFASGSLPEPIQKFFKDLGYKVVYCQSHQLDNDPSFYTVSW